MFVCDHRLQWATSKILDRVVNMRPLFGLFTESLIEGVAPLETPLQSLGWH